MLKVKGSIVWGKYNIETEWKMRLHVLFHMYIWRLRIMKYFLILFGNTTVPNE